MKNMYYAAVLNEVDNRHTELNIYYTDGSKAVYHLPEERGIADEILKDMADQYGMKNRDELLDNGIFIETTPEYFDEIEENIAFSLDSEMEEESNEDEDTSTMSDEGSTGNQEEIDEFEKLLENYNPPIANFVVISRDGDSLKFNVFAQNGVGYEYDIQNLTQELVNEVLLILVELGRRNGFEFDINDYSNADLKDLSKFLKEKELLYDYDQKEFEDLLPHMENLNDQMNDAIHENSQNQQEYQFEDYFDMDYDDSVLNNSSNTQSNGTNNNTNSQHSAPGTDPDEKSNNAGPYTKGEAKAAKKCQKAYDKATQKYYKRMNKEAEKKKMAGMSRKEKRSYKRDNRKDARKEFLGKIPVIGRFVNKNKPKTKKKVGILRRIARYMLIGITTLVIGFVGLFSKDISKSIKGLFHQNTVENQINNSNNKTKNNNSKNNTKKYKNIKDALSNANINDSKKHAISAVSDFLRSFNTKIANENSNKNQKSKLAHTWDEVMAFYLGVNNIAQQKINDIFDGYNFDAGKFFDAFKKGVQQDVQAYIVNKDSINKDRLLENNKGQMFLTNYEKILIKFKSLTDKSDLTREAVANQFYDMVKKDYLAKDAEMKPYKAAALPIIKAMNKLTSNLHFENKLSSDERQEVNNKVYDDVSRRLKKYENNLAAHIAVGGVTTNDELSYQDLKTLAVNELKKGNSYNVIAKNRDITNQKNYKVVIKNSKPTAKEETKNTTTKSNNKSEETKKQTTYTVKVKKSKDTNKKKDKTKSDKIQTVDSNWSELHPVENEFFDFDEDSSIIFHPSTDDSQFDRDHFDDITFDDILDNGTIDDSYQDENGNLDNSVKDPTTDSTGAVDDGTELPDPNVPGSEEMAGNQDSSINEVIADQIIEDMANNPISTSDSIKVYYK